LATNLTLKRSVAENTVDHLGVVTANTADSALTHTTVTTAWADLGAALAEVPFDGLAAFVRFASASGFTSTGATGTASLVVKLDFGDDGTNAKTSYSSQALLATFASSASPGFTVGGGSTVYPPPTTYRLLLPGSLQHRYVRAVFTTTLGTITGANYGLMDARIDMKGDMGNHVIEIG
jgi:hypothetical protein